MYEQQGSPRGLCGAACGCVSIDVWSLLSRAGAGPGAPSELDNHVPHHLSSTG